MSTARMASFVVGTSYENIPQQVIAAAKRCFLDGLGVSLAGSVEPVSKIIISYLKDAGGKPESGVINGKFRTCAHEAALANGIMAHALDYDDALTGWGGHLTAVILPTVLALGEREKASGKDTLLAFILGWEVGEKMGAQIGSRLMQLGWHPIAIVGPLAAAAAGCRILKLDEKQTRMAMGIAASESVGLRSNFGTDTKPFHTGKAARGGVMAALLAQKGYTANESILEGDLGLAKMFTGDEWDPVTMGLGLGAPFGMVSPGVSVKKYSCCGLTHRCIDAMLYLIKEHHIVAEDVVVVECETHPGVPKTASFSRPQTVTQGRFSMHYGMAAALLDGEVTLRQYTREKITSARAQDLMEKVKYVHPEGSKQEAGDARGQQAVTVLLRNGKRYRHSVAHNRGEPQNPMTFEEIASKFRDCAEIALPSKDVGRAIDLVSDLDSLKDITGLMEVVTTR